MKIGKLIKELEKLDKDKEIGILDVDNDIISNLDIEEYSKEGFGEFKVINKDCDYILY